METNNAFIIFFKGKAIKISKSDVNFKYGYAVISTSTNLYTKDKNGSIYDCSYNIKGVIDEKYNTVFPFEDYNREINIFPKGNIIVSSFPSKIDEEAFGAYINNHYKFKQGGFERSVGRLVGFNYEIVNDTTIVLKDGLNSVLYDVVNQKYISNVFSKISKFEYRNSNETEKMAKAVLKVQYGNESINMYDISCYINEKGIIKTPLYVPFINDSISMEEMSFDDALIYIDNKVKNQLYNVNREDKCLVKKLLRVS